MVIKTAVSSAAPVVAWQEATEMMESGALEEVTLAAGLEMAPSSVTVLSICSLFWNVPVIVSIAIWVEVT